MADEAEPNVITDETGAQFVQRPMTLDTLATTPKPRTKPEAKRRGRPPKVDPEARIKVYHKRRCVMHLTDCKLGPEEEGYILASDAEKPTVAPYILKLA